MTLFLVVGCAGLRPSRIDVATYRAQDDFHCQQVAVEPQETLGAQTKFSANGCSKTGVYVVSCKAGATCQAYSEAEWTKTEARDSASSMTYSVMNECRDPVHLDDTGNQRKFSLAPGGNELIVGKVGDELELTDDAGTVLSKLTISEANRSLRVTSACVTLAQ
ncbi:MAG: hypothetical protein ABI467_03125 [Kofleriaceae bacterium]